MAREDIKNHIRIFRERIRQYLEDEVFAHQIELTTAQEISKMLDRKLVSTIVSFKDLESVVMDLKSEYPNLEKLFEGALYHCMIVQKCTIIDTQIIPLVEKGDLDTALKKLVELK
jgi:hypothetical protein